MIVTLNNPGKWKPFRWGIFLSFLANFLIWADCQDKNNTCNINSWGQYLLSWVGVFIFITSILYLITLFSLWLTPSDDYDKDWWKP